MTDETKLFTIIEIADLLEETPFRVSCVITRLRIEPLKRIGLIRLFDSRQIRKIKAGCSIPRG